MITKYMTAQKIYASNNFGIMFGRGSITIWFMKYHIILFPLAQVDIEDVDYIEENL